MKKNWKKIHSSSDKIVWLNSINNERKICYFTYEDGKTPLPKGWKRWFSNTRRLFYYTYIDNNGRKQIKWSPSKFNQHDYSPKEEPRTFDLDLEDVVKRTFNLDLQDDVKRTFNLDLQDDVKRIYDTADGNINLKWHGNIIPCIVVTTEDKRNIRILGDDDDCLEFSIFKDGTAYIDLLKVFNNNCPGPKQQQGKFFLELVDEICRQLEIKTLELVDESTITSKDGLRGVSLEFQSLMKYGYSWYERHGFHYQSKTKKLIVNQIRKTPISKIKDFLIGFAKDLNGDTKQLKDKLKKQALENWYRKYPVFREEEYVKSLVKQYTDKSYDKTIPQIKILMMRTKFFLALNELDYDFSGLPSKINNILRIIEEYRKNEENPDSLSGFLTYVWNKNDSNNFREYIKILSVLYPDIKEGTMYIDERILPAFPTDSNMIKEFSK
jgi:hypothetical protein